ncbi:hypothetical protein CBR_g48571 [Chara braunii]|uniref:Reverse transcriptase domain-containing protein n=1 Tax=Chara braunii TaxID=69332 RepID=A0A388M334_CHABU|nr:hypothetical protein CBR_g48571 [Chara braunii]|eukprot:GBG88961.1 hypothetical protein CBR_g48571 [Chara braunii]
MCGVIPDINGGYTSGKSGWGILGKKVRVTPHWSLGTALATVELCLRGPLINNGDETCPDVATTHAPPAAHGKRRRMGGITPGKLQDPRDRYGMESRDLGKRPGVHDGGMFAGWLGKEMASQEQNDGQQSRGSQGTDRDKEGNEGSDRESAKREGTREDGKGRSTGESSRKAGGSKRGPQENREERENERPSPRNSEGTTPKKTKVSDTRRKLAEIERRTAEYKARLMEQMMVGNEGDPQGEGSREGRRTSQGEARYEAKDNSHRGTPSMKGQKKGDSPAIKAEKATTLPAIDSDASRLPTTPKVMKGGDGLWSLKERVLGWFDPEGTPKAVEKRKESNEGEGTSAVGEAGSSEGGLKRIVVTLTRALNKNQGYLANAKKKLTFDGANITEFLIDYENLAALLKWTEEEKMDHLGQHVSLSLGRDIMAIVASSGSWKETRNEMMRKYLKAEKMATEAELAAVQRKNYATYNDFLRAFTLVAMRIPGVTDRIMSKYFLRQFSEFDKDKILSAYQQTSKFEYTRDVDFSTVTDLAEKTVVTKTLTLLKEGEVIDLTGKTGDKVKKGIESLHERVHGVDNKMDRMKNALLVMQAQVSRPALPPQEAVVPAAVANRGFGRRDPTNERCKYCTMIEHFVRACPRLNHDQQETEVGEQEKVYGKVREENPVDKAMAAKKKFRYQISILTSPEIDGTLSKLLGTMVSVSFSTMLQASPKLLKGLRQLLTRKRVEVEENPEPQGQEMEEAEAPQGVSNLQRILEDLEDLEKAFADIRLSLPNREGGEVMKFGIAAEITDLLSGKIDSFVAEPTASPYANKWFVFRKPNKTLRWIQDLQKLNAVTIRDAGSLPQADLLAESHVGRSIYSLIDLYSGYDQLPLDARDRPYTAMHTPVGQLQMQVTPMGFTNAVEEAQRRMLVVAGDMFPEKCESYIDDNPLKGARDKDETEVEPGLRKFVWDHLQDIKDLLQRFLVYNITASRPKSILAVPKVTILGFRCGAYGRRPDSAKTDKISQWSTPLRPTTEVRAFLGVVGFWRIFIKGFAKIAEPIRAIGKKALWSGPMIGRRQPRPSKTFCLPIRLP